MGSSKKSDASTLPEKKPDLAESSSSGITRWILQKILQFGGNPPICLHMGNGASVCSGTEPRLNAVHIKNYKTLLKMLLHPDLYFGEAYMTKDIEVEGDLESLLRTVYVHKHRQGKRYWSEQVAYWWQKLKLDNSLTQSKENIYHHYDISNEFYQLWLDQDHMQYTCAYYESPDMTLEEAQAAKLHHVCRKLGLKAGQTVVEAGCGWGGLARFMAKHYGVHVKAYNISHEQVKFARQRAEEQGLGHLVEYVEDDFRNIDGQYDAFVSVGMLEHVGLSNYDELGELLRRVLKPHGRGLLHSIGYNRSALMNAWIEKHIFPNARPPALYEMVSILGPHHLSVLDVENLRLHYAQTLRDWYQRFNDNIDDVKGMFDEEFIRAWRLYLVGSIAAFDTSQLQLFQVLFTHDVNNEIPRSRQYIYDGKSPVEDFHA